jgi:hypothetical protein
MVCLVRVGDIVVIAFSRACFHYSFCSGRDWTHTVIQRAKEIDELISKPTYSFLW